jgi:hypothetical protein
MDGNMVSVSDERGVMCSYQYGNVPFKPYVKELYTPGGINVLLDAPADHLHHHGLMFAVGVNGIDYWGETPGCGVQKHVRMGIFAHCSDEWGFHEELRWVDPKSGAALVEENRRVFAHRTSDGEGTLLTWESSFSMVNETEKVILDGRHYFGLGMRFVRQMDTTGVFVNSEGVEGKVYRGEERLLRARWCAYTAEVEGKGVTVAMFDSSKNPRHPATWFTMKIPFAYMAGTLALDEEPFVPEAGKELILRYGVVVWDGKVDTEKIEEAYREWAK